MKKAIATKPNEPTKYVNLTQPEIDARNADIARAEAKAEAEAPYRRLSELDALIEGKSARIIEDLVKGEQIHSDVQAWIDEKEQIREGLNA